MNKIFRKFGYPEVVWLPKGERSFLAFICTCFLIAMFVAPYPQYAMWAGFLFAAYAAVQMIASKHLEPSSHQIKKKSGGYYGCLLEVFFSQHIATAIFSQILLEHLMPAVIRLEMELLTET